MKKYLFILSVFISINFVSKAQADTIVTNLNVKASVLNTVATFLKGNDDVRALNALLKFSVEYRDGTIPNDNANVNIDTVYTDVLIIMYGFLRENVHMQTAFSDFASDITSKRNTNSRLDAGCDLIDTGFSARATAIAVAGKKYLVGK